MISQPFAVDGHPAPRLRSEQRAAILARVAPLVVAEDHPVRRARLLARAAAALGGGRAVMWERNRATETLRALAVIDRPGETPDPFTQGSSGITSLPQVRHIAMGEGLVGLAVTSGVEQQCDVFTPELDNLRKLIRLDSEVLGFTPAALIVLPLAQTGIVLGALQVAQPVGSSGFTPLDLQYLRAVAAIGALALDLPPLPELITTIKSLAMAVAVPTPHWSFHLTGRLSAAAESAVVLLVREALQNVAQHAHARHCSVEIRQEDEWVHAQVRDDGVGFDSEALLAHYSDENARGLLYLHDHLRALSATLSIRTHPNEGTLVAAKIPCNAISPR